MTSPRDEATDEREPISVTVVTQVAAHEGVDPIELTPLYDAVEPDALDSFVKSTLTNPDADGRVTFTYHGYKVRVSCDGDVVITSVEDAESEHDSSDRRLGDCGR